MAYISYEFYNGKDVYNDGDVEQRLLEHYKNGTDIDENADDIFYLTTHIRTNILNWYPFTSDDEVLEIGSGCGTLTQMLCENCKSVYSVEGSKRRAEITYERNKNYDNLKVYAGEFGKFSIEKKFDYVILIGVFEYAKRFFDVENPSEYFLKEIRKVLKDTGKVLIAIENRYGLKYWAGANEDHLGMPFVGLSEYDKYDVQTFGVKEMTELIKKIGFTKYKFYYPFPDYKLPEVIYTDKRVPNRDELRTLPIYLYGCQSDFDIRKVYSGLIDNEQFGFFSNSYIIEFGNDKAELSDVIYAKEVSYREEEFRIVTIQKEDLTFKKVALKENAEEHLKDMQYVYKKLREEGIPIVCQNFDTEGKLDIECCKGRSVAEYIASRMESEGMEGCKAELDRLWEFYCSISDKHKFQHPIDERLRELYPDENFILKVSLLDGNASNIMVDEHQNYIFIDQEWMSDKELPAEFLMFFSILHIVNVNGIKLDILGELCRLYGITEEKQNVFLDINRAYYKKIIADKVRKRQEELNECSGKTGLDTTPVCYYDTGYGFNEEQKIYGAYSQQGEWQKVVFEFPEKVKNVRLDPALCGEKYLTFSEMLVNGKRVQYTTWNIIELQNKKLMVKKNPYIVLQYEENKIEFSINIRKMTLLEMEEYLKYTNEKNN